MPNEDIPVSVHLMLDLGNGRSSKIGLWSTPCKTNHMTDATWSWQPLDGGAGALPKEGGGAEFVSAGFVKAPHLGLFHTANGVKEAVVSLYGFQWPPPPPNCNLDYSYTKPPSSGRWRMLPVQNIDPPSMRKWALAGIDATRQKQHAKNVYRNDMVDPIFSMWNFAGGFDCYDLHYPWAETMVAYQGRMLLGRELNYYFIGQIYRYFNYSWAATRSVMSTWKHFMYTFQDKGPGTSFVSDNDVWSAGLGFDEEPRIEELYNQMNRADHRWDKMYSPMDIRPQQPPQPPPQPGEFPRGPKI